MHQMIHLSQRFHLPDLDVVLVTDDFCPKKDYPHRSHDGEYDRCPRLVSTNVSFPYVLDPQKL